MPRWIFFGSLILLLLAPAAPLWAQGLSPLEAIYCPASPEERARQCRQSESAIQRNQKLLATVGRQMHDSDILLVRVARAPGESLGLYRERIEQQQGVATAESNRWLPIRGRYYDTERQVVYVALDRRDYWQYVWEKLAPDEALARRTFQQRERESRRYKETRYTGPGGQLAQWEREIESARRFQQACCRSLPEGAAGEAPPIPPERRDAP